MKELILSIITTLCPSCVTYSPTCGPELFYSCKNNKCEVKYTEWNSSNQITLEKHFMDIKSKEKNKLEVRQHSFICVE